MGIMTKSELDRYLQNLARLSGKDTAGKRDTPPVLPEKQALGTNNPTGIALE